MIRQSPCVPRFDLDSDARFLLRNILIRAINRNFKPGCPPLIRTLGVIVARKKDTDLLDRLAEVSIRRILLHPVFLFLVATMLVMTAAISTWNRYQFDIVQIEDYRLTRENILLSPPQPAWAKSDIKQMILDQYAEDRATTLESALVPQTANLFQSVGWVEQVQRVEKSKHALEVDLVYRDPVALVKIGGPRPWLPVDRHGVVLDGEMVTPATPGESIVRNYLLIYVFKPDVTHLSTWQRWDDQRIRGAAAISKRLEPHWRTLGVKQIVTLQTPDDPTPIRDFELRPTNGEKGTIVIWGSAPGMESEGEASPAQKIDAISQYVLEYGSLEQSQGEGIVIDVRSGVPIPGIRVRTAAQKNILDSLK